MKGRLSGSRIPGFVVLLGFAWASPCTAAEAGEAGRLIVLVCDSAGVPPATLVEALREASRIFLKAGLETEWRDCSVTHVSEAKDLEWETTCHRPRDPAQMVLEILRRPNGARYVEAGGFARLPSTGHPGVCAGAFYERAEDLARLGDASKAQILAYLAAHEIGHLLLGLGAHTADGIMRPEWSREDLRRAAWGRLAFEPWQAERLHSGLLARTGASLAQ